MVSYAETQALRDLVDAQEELASARKIDRGCLIGLGCGTGLVLFGGWMTAAFSPLWFPFLVGGGLVVMVSITAAVAADYDLPRLEKNAKRAQRTYDDYVMGYLK
ncbi:hypothetical protein ACFU44_00575 [Nocardia rhizosphaerihabitans]|uniref:hypothetical protein n=1 Tax=Nocardia rhizosphaerihabitans TaxID=1691570 RepID=UPI00367001B5